jgi:hypothetical protein
VKSVELGNEVLSLQQMSHDTQSIHEMHFFWLENIEGVNLMIWLHGQLVLKAKQARKPSDRDLISLSISLPHELLSIGIKVQSGIELTDDLIVPVVLEAHNLSHLKFITHSFDLIEDGVTPSSHPIPINPLGLHHGFLHIEVDRAIPICVKVRPEPRVGTLLVAIIHRITTLLIDCFMLGFLWIFVRHAVGALNGRVDLEELMVIIFFLAGGGRMVMWARWWRRMRHKRLSLATLLGGGPGNVLPTLGALLPTRIHACDR